MADGHYQKVLVRQFDIQCGHCEDCGAMVRGRHALQTADAVGAAASQLGPTRTMPLPRFELPLGASKPPPCSLSFTVVELDQKCQVMRPSRLANKEVGLTHGKITRVMKILFGLKIGRATLCHSLLRTAKKCEPA